MKVKENFCPEFRKEEVLKTQGDMDLFEITHKDNGLFYSTYLLYDKKHNISYVEFFIPNPRINSSAKDFYLKYQHGARTFMKDFFEIYVENEKEMESQFPEQETDMYYVDSYEETGERSVCLKIKDSNFLVCIIELSTKEKSLRLAKNIINYFAGKPIEFDWNDLKFDIKDVREDL